MINVFKKLIKIKFSQFCSFPLGSSLGVSAMTTKRLALHFDDLRERRVFFPPIAVMRLTPPSKLFFLISLTLFVIGALGVFGVVSVGFNLSYTLMAAWIVLALGCLLKGV